ncbi:uncharacterized protein BO66DRAFT_392751 [Aspergillus aculeatinus CBS 121060]|uniref:Uncharacterized protein n=1 Tax=Aspergillus aculeatinus CBS 121060 TaxID=1448322 RepID=A0ACD1H5R8_9EURO|nr:hypothetical protein BO66DRAFT_392751 [Aspergillus aculeatinus CBS 121060]RAH68933.1 hypothetical protein BO66DRAFT_392751 [Aspergillus aculeatinus CBS 121060]
MIPTATILSGFLGGLVCTYSTYGVRSTLILLILEPGGEDVLMQAQPRSRSMDKNG